jgi:phage repressor protein C with HTH and peptisase S24 domain
MQGRIESGQLVTIKPADSTFLKGDIVLCKVNGKQYLHLISAVSNGRYQISNNKGYVNGWTTANNIFGVVTNVE